MPARRRKFAAQQKRADKVALGRAAVGSTPLRVGGTGVHISPSVRAEARGLFGRKLAPWATHIERVAVRFEDINGPRGGVDIVCRVLLTLSGLPPVFVEQTRSDVLLALRAAAGSTEHALRRTLGKARKGTPEPTLPPDEEPRPIPHTSTKRPDAGRLIGRSVGRGRENLERAVARPEKEHPGVWVDTSAPGVSATDRRVGYGSTAARNTKRNISRATSTLEDSAQARPSRKSTRRSANRARRDSNQALRALRKTSSASAQAARARVRDRAG